MMKIWNLFVKKMAEAGTPGFHPHPIGGPTGRVRGPTGRSGGSPAEAGAPPIGIYASQKTPDLPSFWDSTLRILVIFEIRLRYFVHS